MRRWTSAVVLQFVLQYRHGFYAATLVILVPTVILLRLLDQDGLAWLLPPVLLQVACINGLFFAAGLFYYESSEKTSLAQAVTPLSMGEVVGAKAVSLTLLTVAEGVAIVLGTYQGGLNFTALIGGLAAATAMLAWVGIALAARFASISEFIMPATFLSLFLLWPLLHYLGLGPDWTVLAHPLQGAMDLFVIATEQQAARLTVAMALTPAWLALACWWGVNRSHHSLRRAG